MGKNYAINSDGTGTRVRHPQPKVNQRRPHCKTQQFYSSNQPRSNPQDERKMVTPPTNIVTNWNALCRRLLETTAETERDAGWRETVNGIWVCDDHCTSMCTNN